MKKLKRELKLTEDGSHTFYMPDLNEHYHSTHGAIQEAMHIYLNAGFHFCKKNPVHILEIGFGTGLNCFLSLLEAQKNNREVIYHAIELFPVDQELIEALNYKEQIQSPDSNLFLELHLCDWNTEIQLTTDFSLSKIQADVLDYDFRHNYDLIYFDAFAPDVQPELWTEDVFKKIYEASNPGAVLTSYSTKGIVKRTLRASGFTVQRLPGPPGKRQMIRATKLEESSLV